MDSLFNSAGDQLRPLRVEVPDRDSGVVEILLRAIAEKIGADLSPLDVCSDCGRMRFQHEDDLGRRADWLHATNTKRLRAARGTTMESFERQLCAVLNRCSAENASNTPDFILAQYLVGCLNAWNRATQQRETIGKHTLPSALLIRALVVFVICLSLVILATWLILLTNPCSLNQTLFEVMSAYSTTGLSLGITTGLNTVGRLIIIFTMFAGRLGAITIMISLLGRDPSTKLVDYPEESILIG